MWTGFQASENSVQLWVDACRSAIVLERFPKAQARFTFSNQVPTHRRVNISRQAVCTKWCKVKESCPPEKCSWGSFQLWGNRFMPKAVWSERNGIVLSIGRALPPCTRMSQCSTWLWTVGHGCCCCWVHAMTSHEFTGKQFQKSSEWIY